MKKTILKLNSGLNIKPFHWIKIIISLSCTAIIFLFFAGPVWAGEMSADYSACVLKKMQGQEKNVMRFAMTVCESNFPYRKTLYKIRYPYDDKSFFDDMIYSNVTSTNESLIGVAFTENRSKNNLLSIKLGFGKKRSSAGRCEPIDKYKTLDFVRDNSKDLTYALDEDLKVHMFDCIVVIHVWGIRRLGE